MLDTSRFPMHAASLSHCLVPRRSPRPHTKLVCTFCWFLSNILPSGWIVGSFPAPGEEELERKGRICGCVFTGKFWTLVRRYWSNLCRHLVNPGSIIRVPERCLGTRCIFGIRRGSSGQNFFVRRVQYIYPSSPIPTPRYLLI